MKRNNEPVRGTKDYLPKEMAIREQVKSTILNTYKSFGFIEEGKRKAYYSDNNEDAIIMWLNVTKDERMN